MVALALALVAGVGAAATEDRPESAAAAESAPVLVTDNEKVVPTLTFTPEQGRWLVEMYRQDQERKTFLFTVAAIVASTPERLWRIMWCESGRPYGLPAYEPNWYITNLHGDSTSSGGAQFVDGTWRAYRPPAAAGYARAYQAPWFLQLQAANALYADKGTGPWVSSSGCWA